MVRRPQCVFAFSVAYLSVCISTVAQASWKASKTGSSVRDLHREYNNIFKYGNRNAASHKWTTFLHERSTEMEASHFEHMNSGFCAVSGSPVNPVDYNRYGLTLRMVPENRAAGAKAFGFMHYCCWPCVCDTQDFIFIDTKTIATKDHPEGKEYFFAVLGDACENEEIMDEPFVQPFYARGETTIRREAPEVRCEVNSTSGKKYLDGATLSDNGYVIVSVFFDATRVDSDSTSLTLSGQSPTPGKISENAEGKKYQSEHEFSQMCEDRKNNGYNSGMGEIFRRVAAMTPIPDQLLPAPDSCADDRLACGVGKPRIQMAESNEEL